MEGTPMAHPQTYMKQVQEIAAAIDGQAIEAMVRELVALRSRGGRLFLLGVGGSAANASPLGAARFRFGLCGALALALEYRNATLWIC